MHRVKAIKKWAVMKAKEALDEHPHGKDLKAILIPLIKYKVCEYFKDDGSTEGIHSMIKKLISQADKDGKLYFTLSDIDKHWRYFGMDEYCLTKKDLHELEKMIHRADKKHAEMMENVETDEHYTKNDKGKSNPQDHSGYPPYDYYENMKKHKNHKNEDYNNLKGYDRTGNPHKLFDKHDYVETGDWNKVVAKDMAHIKEDVNKVLPVKAMEPSKTTA